jgi:DNA-binding MarR family transcriptional regulator
MGELLASLEQAAHLIGSDLEPTASRLGITQAEAHVLAQLERHGPTPIATLHHRFGHKRSTLTNILDRLERRRFVRRQLNPDDRRSFVIHLTPAGRRTARSVTDAIDQLERELTARLGGRDLTGLEAAVETLRAVVGERAPGGRRRG